MELLIYNLSHSDLILGFKPDPSSSNFFLTRPRFSKFNPITIELLNYIKKTQNSNEINPNSDDKSSKYNVKLIQYPLYSRTSKNEISADNYFVGFEFIDSCPSFPYNYLRFKDSDEDNLLHLKDSNISIKYIFFPLISVLIYKWLHTESFISNNLEKTILLISGSGESIDSSQNPSINTSNLLENTSNLSIIPPNNTSNNQSSLNFLNSTQNLSKILKIYIELLGKNIKTRRLNDDKNLFKYYDNIILINNKLIPIINNIRENIRKKFHKDWKDHFKVIISFVDGSTARISSINTSLKQYTPSYIHFWMLKSFWREKKVYIDDLEVYNYNSIHGEISYTLESLEHAEEEKKREILSEKNNESDSETSLTIEEEKEYEQSKKDNALIKEVINEMILFRNEFIQMLSDNKKNDLNQFWLRKTKKPVLSVLLVQKSDENGVPIPSSRKIYRGTNMEVSMPTGSLCAERNVIGTALASDLTLLREDIKLIAVYSFNSALFTSSNIKFRSDSCLSESESITNEFCSPCKASDENGTTTTSPLSSPPAISSTPLSSSGTSSDAAFNPRKKTEEDMNPLKPCGSCNEWLKKIAEVNPNLKVITFADANATSFFIESVTEF